VVSFMLQPFYPREKIPQYPAHGRLKMSCFGINKQTNKQTNQSVTRAE